MLNKLKILIARACSYGTEYHQVGTWLFVTGMQLAKDHRFESAWTHVDTRHRIHHARNFLSRWALDHGMDYVFMVDGDMHLDFRLPNPALPLDRQPDARPWAKPFLFSSLEFLMSNPGGVVGAPALQGPPEQKVNAFVHDPTVQGDVRRMTHADLKATEPGMLPVIAVGTGAMLIDVNVFRKVPEPWFEDVEDDNKYEATHTQDCHFCIKCNRLNIPVYANLAAPARHLKVANIDPPEYEPCPNESPATFCQTPSAPSLPAQPSPASSTSRATLWVPPSSPQA